MVKFILGAAFALALATSANAAIPGAPVGGGGDVIHVAQGCGPGGWRGPQGNCHRRVWRRVCPRGMHLGPHGRRCWPN